MSPTYDPDAEMGAELRQYDELYSQTEVDDSFTDIPDGQYQVIVDKVQLKLTREKQKPMISWQFRILAPRFKGRVIFSNRVITSDTIGFVKRDLKVCGLELDRFSDLWRRYGELRGIVLEVTQKTNGEFTNIYFNRRLTIDPNAAQFSGSIDPSQAANGAGGDRIPF